MFALGSGKTLLVLTGREKVFTNNHRPTTARTMMDSFDILLVKATVLAERCDA
jgi:hypothetical protein